MPAASKPPPESLLSIHPSGCPISHAPPLVMEEFRSIVRLLTVASLALAALQIYLTLNKLWIRKHERAVAESISIYGELVGLVPLFLLTLSFMLDQQWEGVVDGVLWLTAGAIVIAIGSGRWVEGHRGRGFWQLVKDAMALERTEVGDLARAFFRPSGADTVLDLLAQVALIDEELDDRERDFVQTFADSWGIELSWDDLSRRRTEGGLDAIRLRDTVVRYLATSPPPGQVAQLGDVVVSLVHADEQVTPEEELVLSEVGGMLGAYVDGKADQPRFAVALVPQSEEQDLAIRSLLPGLSKEPVAGGSAYVVGRYFSDEYAEVVGAQYRALNVFTTVLQLPEVEA